MPAIHFISGLPRSGSTLLAALLRQNPRFEAGMSGPLAGLFGALLTEMSARNEFSIFIDDAKRERILHGLFDSYYADSAARATDHPMRAAASAAARANRVLPTPAAPATTMPLYSPPVSASPIRRSSSARPVSGQRDTTMQMLVAQPPDRPTLCGATPKMGVKCWWFE
jgi:hypothetical protein